MMRYISRFGSSHPSAPQLSARVLSFPGHSSRPSSLVVPALRQRLKSHACPILSSSSARCVNATNAAYDSGILRTTQHSYAAGRYNAWTSTTRPRTAQRLAWCPVCSTWSVPSSPKTISCECYNIIVLFKKSHYLPRLMRLCSQIRTDLELHIPIAPTAVSPTSFSLQHL